MAFNKACRSSSAFLRWAQEPSFLCPLLGLFWMIFHQNAGCSSVHPSCSNPHTYIAHSVPHGSSSVLVLSVGHWDCYLVWWIDDRGHDLLRSVVSLEAVAKLLSPIRSPSASYGAGSVQQVRPATGLPPLTFQILCWRKDNISGCLGLL